MNLLGYFRDLKDSRLKIVALVSVIFWATSVLAVVEHQTHTRGVHVDRQNPPNIVFILVDDLGYNDVGYNGHHHGSVIRTPNIDKLASEGIILDNYYVDPVCTPSRAELMTGRYTIRYGLQHGVILPPMPSCLPLDEVTLAEQLRYIGYATHAIGKWHLGFYKEECLPTNRGFDTFFGSYSTGVDHYSYNKTMFYGSSLLGKYFGIGEGASGTDLHMDTATFSEVPRFLFSEGNAAYSTELYTRVAQRVIRQHAASRKDPLFLYLPYSAVHFPVQAPGRYKEPYKHVIDDEARLTYAGMVACVDEGIGNLTKTLKDTGLCDNTIIIFSSDNGGSVIYSGNNWPYRGSKDTLFEGGIRGVGFVHSALLPDDVRGTTSHALTHITDWFPTILYAIAGSDSHLEKPIDGHNVWKAILSKEASPRTEILHSIDPISYSDRSGLTPRAALRMEDWKLLMGNLCIEPWESLHIADPFMCNWYPPKESNLSVVTGVEQPEKTTWLFNIALDPFEQHDMSSERPGIVLRMLQRLKEYTNIAVPPWYPPYDINSKPEYNGGVWEPWE